jgi:hypothetical protein
MRTNNEIQAAWISSLKSKTDITSLLSKVHEIRERQWQGDDFEYPAVRVSVELFPSTTRCSDRATILIDVFSEEKSSKECQEISAAIAKEYHGKPFSDGTLRFSSVLVTRISRVERSIYAWTQQIELSVWVS